MKRDTKVLILAAILAISIIAMSTPQQSYAFKLGDIVKVGGVAFVVDKFGDQINKFVNTLTANKNLGSKEDTAVVPIITLGSGGYVGAVQVIGAKDNVEKTKAVVQIEGNAVFGSNIRAKALVPVGSRTTSNIKRIYGVGVSAIIDIRI